MNVAVVVEEVDVVVDDVSIVVVSDDVSVVVGDDVSVVVVGDEVPVVVVGDDVSVVADDVAAVVNDVVKEVALPVMEKVESEDVGTELFACKEGWKGRGAVVGKSGVDEVGHVELEGTPPITRVFPLANVKPLDARG